MTTACASKLDDSPRSVIRAIMQEVLAKYGQTATSKQDDVDEAAELLLVPKRWLCERTSAGAIPHQKSGKFIRFTDADLRAIIGGRP